MFQYKEEWKLVKKEEHDHIDHSRRFTALLIGSMSPTMRNECLLNAEFAGAVNSNQVQIIWNIIRDVCVRKKIANVGQLRRDFYRIRQGSLSFPDFIAEFDRRLAELVLYEVEVSEEDLIMILSSAVDEAFFAEFLKDEYIRDKRVSRENFGESEKKKFLEWKQELMFFYESQILFCRPVAKKIPQVAAVAAKVNKKDKGKKPPAVNPKDKKIPSNDDKRTRIDISSSNIIDVHIVCHRCGGLGHKRPSCPSKSADTSTKEPTKEKPKKVKDVAVAELDIFEENDDDIAGVVTIMEEPIAIVDFAIVSAAEVSEEWFWDTGANVNVAKSDKFLTNIRNSNAKIRGVGGVVSTITAEGDHPVIGVCRILAGAPMNIVSQSQCIADGCSVKYDAATDSFEVSKDSQVMKFTKNNRGLYSCCISDVALSSEHIGPIHKAKLLECGKLDKSLGFPGDDAMIKVINGGGIIDLPITAEDYRIYRKESGASIDAFKGKATAAAQSDQLRDKTTKIGANLHVDLFWIKGSKIKNPFLILKDEATGYVMVIDLISKNTEALLRGIKLGVVHLKSHNHRVRSIISDSEANFKSLESYLNDIKITLDLRAPEVHSSLAERGIRSIKDIARTVINNLQFRLPMKLLKYLIIYTTGIENSKPNKTSGVVSPRELVQGKKLHWKYDFKADFGDIVWVRVPKTGIRNDLSSRGQLGMVVGRSNASIKVWLMDNGEIVTRTKFIKVEPSQTIIDKINLLADNDGSLDIVEDDSAEPEGEVPPIDPVLENSSLIAAYADILHESDLFDAMLSIKEALKGAHNQEVIQALIKELKSMLLYGVWEPVDPNYQGKFIPSMMLVKEKFRADGSFDKWKCRFTAGGHRQGDVHWTKSRSGTLILTSMMSLLTIAAKEKASVTVADVPVAYLNSNVKSDVVMNIDKLIAGYLCNIDPSYNQFKRGDGSILVRLKKSLYGLKESGKNWYDTLSSFLKELDYSMCSKDECVFIKRVGNKFSYIAIYVDDIMIVSNSNVERENIMTSLSSKFGIKEFNKNHFNYLGISISVNQSLGEVKINQKAYIIEYLKSTRDKSPRQVSTPSTRDFFTKDTDQPSNDADLFRSKVMKLMWIAKRSRPDILKEVVFLATKCGQPTSDDDDRLDRIDGYLSGSINRVFTLKPKSLEISAMIDASYGIHEDNKGHTGIIISIGGANILVKSVKQKLVARSSTEAELIALDDGLVEVLWCRQFMDELGFGSDKPSVIYQDNKSTIILALKGNGNTGQTKHIKNRFFFVKQEIDSGEIDIVHLPTDHMVADILTKPLAGKLFQELSSAIQGEYGRKN